MVVVVGEGVVGGMWSEKSGINESELTLARFKRFLIIVLAWINKSIGPFYTSQSANVDITCHSSFQ